MKIIKSNIVLENNHKVKLVTEMELEYNYVDNCNSPGRIVQVCNDVFKLNKLAEEYLYIVCTTAAGDPICFFEVSHGTCSNTIVNGREIMIRALLCGAVNIVMIHNHPSGHIQPSQEDIAVTKRIFDISDIIGIRLVDHVIIGENQYFSFKEKEIKL